MVKTITIHLSDQEYDAVILTKGEKTWREYLLDTSQ